LVADILRAYRAAERSEPGKEGEIPLLI